MSKRRGKRVVVGYVVSHTGKRGGPWEAKDGPFGTATSRLADANRLTPEFVRTCASKGARGHCFYTLGLIRKHHPHARLLPLVRYEVDAEEERLRDAVVEAADHLAGCLAHSDSLDHDQNVERRMAAQDEEEANADLRSCVAALREHLKARKS